jgi:hypothetical protein
VPDRPLLALPALLGNRSPRDPRVQQSLTPIQQFAYDVSAEPMMEGKGFVRNLAIGPFHASSQVDYGDRASGE